MYEPSPFEDSRGLRLSADEDFMRSLDQLEDLLEEDMIAATAQHIQAKEAEIKAARKTSASQNAPELANRFGGSILDAIPLADRLGARLSAGSELGTEGIDQP